MRGARQALTLLVSAIALATLGGCGGGGTPAPASGPATATASGQLDPSYGSSGKVTLSPAAVYGNLAVDGEGNAFISARRPDFAADGAIIKLDPSGAVATSYGDGGRVIVSPGGSWVGAFTIDAAGNVYAATGDLGPVQFDPAGRRVPSFGSVAPLFLSAIPVALARLGDGTFVMASWSSCGFTGQSCSTVSRFDRDGRAPAAQPGISIGSAIPVLAVDGPLDAYVASVEANTARVVKVSGATRALDFGDEGRLALCMGASAGDFDANAIGIDVDASHDIYVATTCLETAGTFRAVIWKFDRLGHPVSTFGNGGSRSAIFGPDSAAAAPRVSSVRVGPDGSVYVAGASDQGGCYKLTIAKLDSQGRDVAAFGTGGRLVVDVPGSTATRIEFDGHGRLYALGYSGATCQPPWKAPLSYFIIRASA